MILLFVSNHFNETFAHSQYFGINIFHECVKNAFFHSSDKSLNIHALHAHEQTRVKIYSGF